MAEAKYPSASSSEEDSHTRSQTLNQKFGDFKKFASTSFSRAKQFTLEKVGKADQVSEFGPEFDTLSQQLDQIKVTTERLLSHVHNLIEPNPGFRFEGIVYSTLDRQKPVHPSPQELFGSELARAGNAFGSETQYGAFLVRCSEIEKKVGESQKRFQEKAQAEFIAPLKAFLEVDIKTVLRERRALNVRRLDYDSCRARSKKPLEGEKQHANEQQLRTAQAEYESQLEKVRVAMKRIVRTHVNHMGHLRTFMSAQRSFFAECLALLGDIEGDPSSQPTVPIITDGEAADTLTDAQGGKFVVQGIELDKEESRKAKVLYDYDPENENELNIFTDQIITVTPIPDDDDWLMAERDGDFGKIFGKIPSTYVELL